jgi:hypothetical protein
MSDDTRPDDDRPIGTDPVASRRRVLALGAVGAAAVVSIRPALAQTAGSVLNCDIPVPDPGRAGSFIDAQGKVVPSGTKGAFPGATRPFKGEEVKRTLATGAQLPGTDGERSRAYVNYIRRLQRGQGGFTCFASLQMPRG